LVELGTLIVFDAGACGFRAAAGRSGLIAKGAYYRKATLVGVGCGFAILAVGLALAWAMASLASSGFLAEFGAAASSSLRVFRPFAVVVVAALGVWLIPNTDLRTLATVSILGPGTLVRPLVVISGLVVGVLARPDPAVIVVAVYGALTMLLVERVLVRLLPRR
jgi:hypothetical protein